MSLQILNGKIFFNGKLIQKNLFLEEGKISEITSKKMPAEETINAKGKIILPGAIDCHVHFREPGMTHKGDWSSESRAAACGGITTVIEMPNTIPATSTVEALKEKKEIAGKKSYCNYGIHFGAEKENLSEIEKAKGIASIKVFMGASTGNLLIEDAETLEKVFMAAKKLNRIVTLHAEEEQIIRENTEKAKRNGWNSVKYHNKIRSSEAEVKAIKKALELQERIGNKMHFCHVSTAQGMKLIDKAKKQSKKISCEVAPHHLFLHEGKLKELKNYGKMNPPLREKKDCAALWKALDAGTVDLIATDHAPHTREEKEKDYWSAPSGVTGVETMLPLMLNAVNEKKISLQRMMELTAQNPCKVYGIKSKGFIAKGFDADLIVVDLKKEQKIKGEELKCKCGWSPFEGIKLKACVEKTIIGGEIIWDIERNYFNENFRGKEVV